MKVETRERAGGFEGDTPRGGTGNGCLLALAGRKTRMPYRDTVIHGLTMGSGEIREASPRYPWERRALAGTAGLSVTPDKGSEFAEFREIERNTGAEAYFAGPHSPWRRGTDENTNGLLRYYVPEGTDFRAVTDGRVKEAPGPLNRRPRKRPGWLSPLEFSLKCRA